MATVEVAKHKVDVLNKGSRKVELSHDQALLARNAEKNNPKAAARHRTKKADYAGYEGDVAKMRSQLLQSSLKRLQFAVYCVKSDIMALGTGLAKGRNDLVCRLEYSTDECLKCL